MAKILLFANTDWYLFNFRLGLIKELRNQGHEIVLLSPPGNFHERLKENGFQWISFSLSRQGINPISETFTLWRLFRLYQQVKPDLVHHFTIKPVIYGSFAAHLLNIHGIINSITGLGHLFIDPGFITSLLRRLAKWLYRFSLHRTQVIFENPEDQNIFIQNKFITLEQSHLILGTGVDVDKFQPTQKTNNIPIVLFSSRLLATKGLIEYMDAIRILKQKGYKARFAIAGTTDPGNPASIPQGQLDAWQQSDLAEFWGWQDDMPTILAKTDIFCLPSYREGIPNALLEACACGLPIVTTDVPGCRDVVQHGVNGLLVAPREAQILAEALVTLLINPALRSTMGKASRQIALEKFSLSHIISQNLGVYAQAMNKHG
jgi:glycosyltransferase involved in cell wall biosynthesis